MPIIINDNSARVQYTATASQTVFTVPYEFFAPADLKVYQNSTLKTIATHYTVTGAGVTGGGTVTFVTGATLNDIITIVRDVAVARTSDFPTSGPFVIEDLNTDLDRLTAMIQQQETKLARTLRLDDFDIPNTFTVLPAKATRASKLLSFDANGNSETTLTAGDIASAQSYATAASASATASAASATSAASSYDSFDDRYLGAKASNPTVDNDGNSLLTGALYFNTTSDEMRVWSGSAWVVSYLSSSGFVVRTGDTMTGVLAFTNGTAALPSITNSGDTNTGIFFPTADTIAFTEGGAEAMRITASGEVGIGTTTPDGNFEVSGIATTQYITRQSTDTSSPVFYFRKSRGTEALRAVNVSGDNMGTINFQGYDNAGDFVTSVQIIADSEGTIGSSRMPGRMLLRTGTNATPTVITTAIEINSSQIADFTNGIRVNANEAYALRTILYKTGSGTYTTPSKVRAIYVEAAGGGGGGGGVDGQGAGTAGAARSGGGGGYCAKFITSPAATYAFAVGAGGTGGAAGNNNATDGGNTTFVGTGTSLNAQGGNGGFGSLGTSGNSGSTPGGTGGIPTGGDINLSGSRAGARSVVAGGIITAVSQSGECPMFGGSYASSPDGAGTNGVNFGSGGSGASGSGTTTNYAGGDGAAGTLRITEYY